MEGINSMLMLFLKLRGDFWYIMFDLILVFLKKKKPPGA